MTELRDVQPDPTGHRLFKVGKSDETSWAQHPGTLSPDQWHARPDIGFHGTMVADPDAIEGPTHFGDVGTAQGVARILPKFGGNVRLRDPRRLGEGRHSFYEDRHERTMDTGDEARVLARRLPKQDPRVYRDTVANTGHIAAAAEGGHLVSPSILASVDSPTAGVAKMLERSPTAARVADNLVAGETIRYRNTGERSEATSHPASPRRRDTGSRERGGREINISYVADMGSTRSYGQDVADAEAKGLTPHPLAADHISSHQFGSVDVESVAVPETISRETQGALFTQGFGHQGWVNMAHDEHGAAFEPDLGAQEHRIMSKRAMLPHYE